MPLLNASHFAALQAAFTVLQQQHDQELSLPSLAQAVGEMVNHASMPEAQKQELQQLHHSLAPFVEDAAPLKEAATAIEDTVALLEQVVDVIFQTVETVRPLSTQPEAQKALDMLVEACSFQDITGQRLRKIKALLAQLRGEVQEVTELRRIQQEAGLLDGPAASGSGMSQDDIDKLF